MKITILILILTTAMSKQFLYQQQSIIELVNNLNTTWKAGHNHYFDGMTIDQIKKLMGVIDTPESLKLPQKDITPNLNIPNEFFSAQNWPKCDSLKDIRDQSACGSCWAIAAAEVMSDRICIASNQTLQTRISAQDILTCCAQTCGNGCNGGIISGAWAFLKKTGAVTGWLYNDKIWCQPYSLPPCSHFNTTTKYPPCGNNQRTPTCKTSCINGKSYLQQRWLASSIYTVPSDVQKIQTEIMAHGPVQAVVVVYQDLISYKSGVYQHTTGAGVGNRSVKIVGWGVENGIPYWLVANSWNQDWGDKGFFKIKRGSNQCAIESQIFAGIPIIKKEAVISSQ